MTNMRERILVVDDTASNRLLLRSMLSKEGYHISECDSGQCCLDICAENLPDLILLDVMMPGIDGFQVCEKLRKTYSQAQLPIILVTAKTDGSDVKHGIELGANDYITKPVDRSIVLARLKNQLTFLRNQRMLHAQQDIIKWSLSVQQAIGDSLDEGIVVNDASGGVVYCNEGYLKFCIDGVPDSISNIAYSLFKGKLSTELSDILQQIFVEPEVTLNKEYSFQQANGERTYLYVYTQPIKVPGKDEHLRLWVFRDITNTRELEKKTRQQVKMDTVSMFAVGVAHNFNNILGSVLGATEIIEKVVADSSTGNRCTSVIKKAVGQGKALTDKMFTLAFNKEEGNTCTRSDLNSIANDIAELYSNGRNKLINFHLNLSEQIPVILINKDTLKVIVDNLFSNAVDAIETSGDVWLLADFDADSNQLLIKFKDSGAGMSPEMLEKLFEPFFSTKNIDVKNGMSMLGNGLGLWNVYNQIKQVDGDIQVFSVLGEGSEVQIKLPCEVRKAVSSTDSEVLSESESNI